MGLKISFGEGGLKGFFAQHAEKVVFGIVMALVAFFIYSSATQEGYDAKNGPDDLKREAASADDHIRKDFWRDIAPERVAKKKDYPKIVDKGRMPIEEGKYLPPHPWNRGVINPQARRDDPELYPPTDVEASGAVYSLAMRNPPTVTDDPWAGIEPAIEEPKEEPKKKKRKKRRSSYGEMGGYGSEMGGYGEEMYGEEDAYGEEEYGSEYSSGYPSASGTAGAPRQLGQWWIKHYIKGVQASGGGGRVAAKGYGLVSVKALVPFEKQWDEYDSVLAGATGYSPEQDIPKYLFFQAERAEVPKDPDAPLDWKPVSDTSVGMRSSAVYAGMAKEIADPAYLMPGVLTMPIPPVLLRSYDELALHSEIPRMQMRTAMTTQPTEETPDVTDLAPTEGGLEEGLPPTRRPGTNPYGGGYGSEYGSGYGSEYGSEYGSGYGSEYGSEYGSDYGSDYESGYEDEYGSDYESGYGSGYGGYGYGSGQPRLRPNVQYKLVRFFDFSAQPGKSYRYRVRAVLEDPNRPQDPKADPSKRILEADVVTRLTDVEQKNAEYTKATGKPRRTYYRTTDWSEASNVVTIINSESFVAGAVTKGRIVTLPNGAEVPQSESSGKLVTVVWDRRKAIEVPVETDVYLGSYLSFEKNADVLHPLAMRIMRLENYEFQTGAVVADIYGGDPLIKDVIVEEVPEGSTRKPEETINEYKTPGEIVVVDANGNIIVCNELDDTEEYRRLLFIEDKPPEPTSGGYDDYAEEGYGDEYGSYGEMYGSEYGDY